MKKALSVFLLLMLLGHMLSAQFPNILIGNTDDPEEPSIVINPKNTSQVLAGANIILFYRSENAGSSWQQGSLSSSYGVWGDPCLIVDTASNFYYFHLSNPPGGNWIDRIVCQKSTDGGQTWSDGTFMGLNGTKAQDKEWAIADPATNNIYVTWTQFDEYGTSNPADSSIILFSKSTDGALTWSSPKRINRVAGDCIDSDNTVEGAVPAVGPNGEIYVSWAGPAGIVFNRSLDQGETWMDTNVYISDIPGGWDITIPGIIRCNGMPVTCCDLSNGPFRGSVYVNWCDQRNGDFDTDVWFSKSIDGGITWSARKRVNDDPPGKHQFFTWMTVDQKTGYIYFVFYDRRAYAAPSTKTDVYMAVSRDGGESFRNFCISESYFVPSSSVFFGDYNGITAYDNVIRPIWTRLNGNRLSVWTAEIDSIFTGIGQKPEPEFASTLEQNYPNPVNNYTYIAYKVHRPVSVTVEVFDFQGRKVTTLVDHKMTSPGRYVETFDNLRYGVAPGLYFYSLVDGERSIRRKMIVE
jgi:hypothetical protein